MPFERGNIYSNILEHKLNLINFIKLAAQTFISLIFPLCWFSLALYASFPGYQCSSGNGSDDFLINNNQVGLLDSKIPISAGQFIKNIENINNNCYLTKTIETNSTQNMFELLDFIQDNVLFDEILSCIGIGKISSR